MRPASTIQSRPVIGSASSMLDRSLTNFSSRLNDASFGRRSTAIPKVLCGGKRTNVREIEVELQQTSVLPNTCFEDKLVARTAEALLEVGFDIVAFLREKARRSRTEVLVKLESHAALLPGKST